MQVVIEKINYVPTIIKCHHVLKIRQMIHCGHHWQKTMPLPGKIGDFISVLQDKLDEKLDGNPPASQTLNDIINI